MQIHALFAGLFTVNMDIVLAVAIMIVRIAVPTEIVIPGIHRMQVLARQYFCSYCLLQPFMPLSMLLNIGLSRNKYRAFVENSGKHHTYLLLYLRSLLSSALLLVSP